METLAMWFHYVAEVLYYINPLMMILACCMWMKLYCSTSRRVDDAMVRFYVLERQIDMVIQSVRHGIPISQMDVDMIERLRKLHE